MSRKRRNAADEPHIVVRSSIADPARDGIIADHVHDWHQLIHLSAGLMTVWTEEGTWVAPPGWAVWAPAGIRHSIRFIDASAFRTLYLRPEAFEQASAHCTAVSISTLMRELIVRTTEIGMLDPRDPVEQALITLIRAEFHWSAMPGFNLRQPEDPRLRQAASLIVANAPEAAGLPSLARAIGMTTRVFERRFSAETGLSPGRWRRHSALLVGLERIAAGAAVKAVAADAGYASSSAFIAAFHKAFGVTPSRFFAAPESR